MNSSPLPPEEVGFHLCDDFSLSGERLSLDPALLGHTDSFTSDHQPSPDPREHEHSKHEQPEHV